MDLPAFLAAHGITPSFDVHPPVMTVAESERLVPPLPGAKTKNLFLRDRRGTHHSKAISRERDAGVLECYGRMNPLLIVRKPIAKGTWYGEPLVGESEQAVQLIQRSAYCREER